MNRKPNRPSLFLSGFFFLLGGAGLLESAILAVHAERATATVVESRSVSTGRRASYDVTIAFRTVDGMQTQAVLKRQHYSDTPIGPGNQVDILYQSNKPQRVRRDLFSKVWGIYAGLAVFGLLVVAMGYIPVSGGPKPQRRRGSSRRSKPRG